METKHYISIRQSGEILDVCDTREQAEAVVREYEADDRASGCYTYNCYSIAEREYLYIDFPGERRIDLNTLMITWKDKRGLHHARVKSYGIVVDSAGTPNSHHFGYTLTVDGLFEITMKPWELRDKLVAMGV